MQHAGLFEFHNGRRSIPRILFGFALILVGLALPANRCLSAHTCYSINRKGKIGHL